MKKRNMITLAVIIILAFAPFVTKAYEEPPKIYIDSVRIESDVPPMIIQGRTLVPVRSLEKLNLNYHWDAQSKTITIQNSDTEDTLVLTQNQTTAYKNNEAVQLDTPVKIINGRTYIPLRFVSTAFDAYVAWVEDYNSIYVISKDKIESYRILLNSEYDLAEARKIAIQLPSNDTSLLVPNSEKNTTDYSYYYFPPGEALRYIHIQNDVKAEYQIGNDGVKIMWWEARYDDNGKIIEEHGIQPTLEKAGYKYFAEFTSLGKAEYGVIGEKGEHIKMGETEFNPNNAAGSSIQNIPDEKRQEYTAFPIIR